MLFYYKTLYYMTCQTILINALLLTHLSQNVHAQLINNQRQETIVSVGLKTYYQQAQIKVDQEYDRYQISSSHKWREGYRIGLFCLVRKNNFFLQPEFNYSYSRLFLQFTNLSPKNNNGVPLYLSDWLIRGEFFTQRTLEIFIPFGLYLNPHVRIQGGPSLVHRLNQARFNDGFSRPNVEFYNPNNEIIYALADSFRKLSVNGRIGIGIDLNRFFTVDLSYDKSLTPPINSVGYNGKSQPFFY